MASLAGMLKARGFKVTGSDMAAYPPMSEFLGSLDIPVAQPFNPENLQPAPDLVIVGNAISRGNPELEHVLDCRIPFQSMAQTVYDEFIRGKQSLVVAGTHGKTTTTSMLAWIFANAGRNPSFLIGGIAENFGSSFAVTEGKEFIIEGDEYDTAFWDKGPKFLHYFPDSVILTSVEFDHADIYKSLDEVKTAFKRLINLVPKRGRVIAWDGSENVAECVARAFCPVETYGFSKNSYWWITDIRYATDRTHWRVLKDRNAWGEFTFAMAGEHNVLNATAATAIASGYGLTPGQIAEGLASFRSVKRRLEVIADVNGVTVIDDFAHHPTAIAETLKALRLRYAGRRIWAVLEPRSNTLRRNVFQHELAKSLALAEETVLAGVFKSDAIPESERLHLDDVVAEIKQLGRPARHFDTAEQIVNAIVPELLPGDVVALLSNGGFGNIYEKLPQRLKSLMAPRP